jgi:hypothetical protein
LFWYKGEGRWRRRKGNIYVKLFIPHTLLIEFLKPKLRPSSSFDAFQLYSLSQPLQFGREGNVDLEGKWTILMYFPFTFGS